jgi:DNA-binding PadR family transcriptional regulator
MNSESTTHHERGFGPRNHGHAPEFAPGFVLGHGGRGRFGAPGFGGFGPRGFLPPGPQRKRRGDVRIAILSLLADKPYNGYGLIKEIAEKSGNTWTPSPGSVYPTLQQLVDEGLIESLGKGPRTEFQLTDDGRSYIAEHADELAQIWATTSERADADAGLHQAIGKLMGVVHQFRFAATEEQRTKAVAALDEARKALYGILAE